MLQNGFSLLVLSGGESSRMGMPKHMLPFGGRTLLEHILKRVEGMFREVLVVGRNPGAFPEGVKPVSDVMAIRAPLVGILSGLLAAESSRSFVLGCDMPFIEPALVAGICSQALSGADVTVPVVRGYREPLCAVYSRSCTPRITECLQSGNLKATGFYHSVTVREVGEQTVREFDPHLNSFININTPGEFRRYSPTAPARRG